jgi:hypothetical protein
LWHKVCYSNGKVKVSVSRVWRFEMTRKMILALLLIATAGLIFSSCLVGIRARPVVPVAVVVGPPVEYGYQPLLYDGYVVYYTDDGIPFYWAGDVRVWVPIEFRARYVSHWRSHRQAYHSWYTHRGHSYRGRQYQGHRQPVRKGHQPVIRPKDRGKPVIKPKDRDESKPVIKPKKKKKDKPVIRPK